jgi:uncharacterized protein (DUF1697 family)
MKYIALIRGINVGSSVKINMKDLKTDCESLSFQNVSTYINSGNVIFESDNTKEIIQQKIEDYLRNKMGQEIKVIVKTKEEIQKIALAIPAEWRNDELQKTDVLYLFNDIDNEEIVNELPIKKEYVNIKYVKGAIIVNVLRDNYNKSQMNKIIAVNAGLIFPLLSGEIFPVSSKKLFEANGSDFQAVLHSVGIRL